MSLQKKHFFLKILLTEITTLLAMLPFLCTTQEIVSISRATIPEAMVALTNTLAQISMAGSNLKPGGLFSPVYTAVLFVYLKGYWTVMLKLCASISE